MALHAFRDSRAVAAIRSKRGKPSSQRYQEQAARALEEFCLASRLSLAELASLLGRATHRDVSPKDLEACLRGDGEFPIWLAPAIADVARRRAATFGSHRPLRARLLLATLGLVVLASMCGVGATASYVGQVDASHRPTASTAGGSSTVTPSRTLPGRMPISAPASSSQPGAAPAASPAPPQAASQQSTSPPQQPTSQRSTSTPVPTSMQAPPVTRQPAPAPPPAAPAPPPTRSVAAPAAAPAPAPPAPAPAAPAPAAPAPAQTPARPANGGGGGGLLGGVLGLLGL